MLDGDAVHAFLSRTIPHVALLPSTRLADVLDSLNFLDFFLFLEQSMGDALTLDEVVQCVTIGDLMSLLESMHSRLE